MKKSILITAMMVALSLMVNARQSLEGTWVNDQHQKKISIRYDRGDLFVYGVYPSYEDGQRFFRASRNKFRDRYGNVVKVESDNFIEIRYSENWRKISFRKISRSRAIESRRQNNRSSCRPHQSTGHSGGLELEGTWFNLELRKELYIIEDRNGFKITFRSGDWKYFERIDTYRYKDNKGNTYTLNPDGSMTWYSYSGDRRFTLEKRSSQIPW